ncbi:Cytochrome c oxidase subunit 6 [Emmonsiellopsis sp. PD_33]|nr:Cytochrome c oxidase subunit 6 [Emmonsiellopsis sp. PD_33]KAK2792520.1 Cytochrome c oxidase subunit 6 [Onygenales sp. PD_10]
MSSTALFRIASRNAPVSFFRASYSARSRVPVFASAAAPAIATFGGLSNFSTTSKCASGGAGHEEETFEEFSASTIVNAICIMVHAEIVEESVWLTDSVQLLRYEKEFDSVQDVFELQRNLNNAFAYDLVPSVSVMAAALKAARRVNDFPTAVRVFEGIRAKVENKGQYELYLQELKGLREELGVSLQEELYPEEQK